MGMIPELEKLYPEGSDITIMNTFYSFPKFEDGKKIEDDYIALVYKDNSKNVKKYKIIKKPDYTYYKLKDGVVPTNYNLLFIERNKVDPVTVPFNDLLKSIAIQTGEEDFYKQNIFNHNKSANNKLHNNTTIFNSDTNIQDHYRFKFANTYTNNINSISKGFFDIEVDAKWASDIFPKLGECPINCVSYLDEKTHTIHVFILRDDRNPQIQQFEDNIKNGTINHKFINNFIKDAVGGPKQVWKYKLENMNFKFNFFDYEIELIRMLFQTMHQCSPDFIEGWNSSAFDIPYIIQRVINLGYDPRDILCDQSWPIKEVKNFIDQEHINEHPERGDYTFISGLPVFIDQMIQYASRRKAKWGSITSVKLDDIGLKEAKVQKLDYHHITKSVTELPWLDFQTFVLYNIMDVIVQKCIETKTQDLEYIFSKCVVNNTSYNKGHRQTVYLINRMAADWYKQGFIIGNNSNRDNPKPPKYLGAIVGLPTNTDDYSKMRLFDGSTIWVCENLVDYDFKSLYPSIMSELNIAPNTQIGRIEIDEVVYKGENP